MRSRYLAPLLALCAATVGGAMHVSQNLPEKQTSTGARVPFNALVLDVKRNSGHRPTVTVSDLDTKGTFPISEATYGILRERDYPNNRDFVCVTRLDIEKKIIELRPGKCSSSVLVPNF